MVDFHPRLAWCEEHVLVAKTNIGPLKISEQLEDYTLAFFRMAYKNDNEGPFWQRMLCWIDVVGPVQPNGDNQGHSGDTTISCFNWDEPMPSCPPSQFLKKNIYTPRKN